MNDEILLTLQDDLKESASAILLVGSFADNLESKTSDIDLFVILKSGFETYSKDYVPMPISGRKVEISFFTNSEANTYLDRSKRDFKSTTLRELEIIYKLFFSRLLQCSPDYEYILSNFEYEQFKIKIIKFYLRQSNGYYDDSVGHYLEGNWFATAIAVQSYLNTYVDAWLASNGDMYPKPQHRIAKAIRQMKPERLEAYCKILLPEAALIRDDLNNYCKNVSIVARQLQAEIFLSAGDYTIIKEQMSPSLKVADWLYIYERGDGFYAKNKTRMYKISRTAYMIILAVSYIEENSRAGLLNKVRSNEAIDVKQININLTNLEEMGILTI